jgi:hypothetical protein
LVCLELSRQRVPPTRPTKAASGRSNGKTLFELLNFEAARVCATLNHSFNTYFTSVVQQPYGYNVTGQLQEPKDLIRPATAKIVFTIL